MKIQRTILNNNLEQRQIFFIGSFTNVLLCYSKISFNDIVCLVYNSNSRKNNKNIELFLRYLQNYYEEMELR